MVKQKISRESLDEIEHIYVLGHSFGEADIEYFENLVRATQDIEVNAEDSYYRMSLEERMHLFGIYPIIVMRIRKELTM